MPFNENGVNTCPECSNVEKLTKDCLLCGRIANASATQAVISSTVTPVLVVGLVVAPDWYDPENARYYHLQHHS